MKALHCQEVSLNGSVFDTRYVVHLSPIFIVGTDVLFEQAPPLGKLRFAVPTTPVYNSTVQKANKVSPRPWRQSVKEENA